MSQNHTKCDSRLNRLNGLVCTTVYVRLHSHGRSSTLQQLTPEFCSCDQQDCISVPSPQPHIPSDCELAAYIEYNLYRWEVPLSQLIRNNWRKSQDYENIIISPREWISEHGLSSASDYATIAYLYSLQL